MRPLRVVFHPPLFDHHLRFLRRVEYFPVQAFQPAKNVKTRADPIIGRYFKFEQTNSMLGGANRTPTKTPQHVTTRSSPIYKFLACQNRHIHLFERSA